MQNQAVLKTGKNYNCDCLSEEQVKKIQNIQLDMLKDIDATMRKYSIKYSLSGGSVIGAVRHKGFIPWDDDIDINMPRKEFEKLYSIAAKEWGKKYTILYPGKTKGYWLGQIRIIKNGTTYKTVFDAASEIKWGIGIDVFIMENTYNNIFLRTVHGIRCLINGFILTCRKNYNDYSVIKKYLVEGSEAEKVIIKKSQIGRLFKWLSLDTATKNAIKCYSSCKNDKSKYVTIPTGRAHFFHETGKREDMCEVIEVPFEDMVTFIPKGYDSYLKRLYGDDYMIIPPKEKQETHPILAIDFEK